MKKFLQLVVPAVAVSVLAGCHSHRAEVRSATGRQAVVVHHPATVRQPATVVYPQGELLVVDAPPAPRQEIVGTAPDERHVWVPGYWANVGRKWVWAPGHWEARPRPTAIWYAGHWDQLPDGRWTWTPGHWN